MNAISHKQLDSLLAKVLDIAYQAGQKILEIYATDFTVEHKQDNSPLTTADLAAHTLICTELTRLTPTMPILSEESAFISFSERSTWQQYWLIDPLDGTREFIKRNGEFSLNIALIEGHQPILGVVYIPVTGVCYSATLNNGARSPISVRKTVADKLIVAGSRAHANKKQQAFIEKLSNPEVLSIGSSLKFCLVAAGRTDIYPRFGPTSEWDSAAAQCIVEEAGGSVVDTKLKRLEYNTKESLLNPAFLVIADQDFNWQQYINPE